MRTRIVRGEGAMESWGADLDGSPRVPAHADRLALRGAQVNV